MSERRRSARSPRWWALCLLMLLLGGLALAPFFGRGGEMLGRGGQGSTSGATTSPARAHPGMPGAVLRGTHPMAVPGVVDSNSPVHWDGDRVYLFTSVGFSFRNAGAGLEQLETPRALVEIRTDDTRPAGRWIEATYLGADALYGWYHLELSEICPAQPGELAITVPEIGAMLSFDNGASWTDLGIVLTGPDRPDCETDNRYFGGGEGDFSVLLDAQHEYFYFLFTAYHRDPSEQGIAVARMRHADRRQPVGAVRKWYRGEWAEPGLGGLVSPVFPAATDWHRAGPNDAFWGPSLHWNTYLGRYVALLNHATDERFQQDGVYMSVNDDLGNPAGWSWPERLLDLAATERDPSKDNFYPQVLGLGAGESDKRVGRMARLFLSGRSEWEIHFLLPGEGPDPP